MRARTVARGCRRRKSDDLELLVGDELTWDIVQAKHHFEAIGPILRRVLAAVERARIHALRRKAAA